MQRVELHEEDTEQDDVEKIKEENKKWVAEKAWAKESIQKRMQAEIESVWGKQL